MFIRNRHLNIFEHYGAKGTLPVENNVSRGFAIILESYPFILDRFIDYINFKCAESQVDLTIQKPESKDNFDVGFQQSIKRIVSSYSDLSTVVGITLTTTLPDSGSGTEKAENDSLITDIAVVVADAIIVIEVKRTAKNASEQCRQQVESLVASLSNEDSTSCINKVLLDGTWEEIIDILQKSAGFLEEGAYSVLSQYLQHLDTHYPQWFPATKLSDIDFAEKNASIIDKRIALAVQHVCYNVDDARHQWGGYTIPVDKASIGAALVIADYEKKSLDVKIWVADTKYQGGKYFGELKDDLSWIYKKQIDVDGLQLDINTVPYVRFAHWQSTIFNEFLCDNYCMEHFGIEKEEWHNLWKAVSYKWKRDQWPDLVELMTNKYAGIVDNQKFIQKFTDGFINRNRNYTDVSLGYEVTVSIPNEIIREREVGSILRAKSTDTLAELIKDITVNMLHHVE